MFSKIKQNILLLIFLILTIDVLVLSAVSIVSLLPRVPLSTGYDVIDCSDSVGKIHKCIRIDPKAGEINDNAKGTSYRVIYGQ